MIESISPRKRLRGVRAPAPSKLRRFPIEVLGWGTAVPRYSYRQDELAEHLSRPLDAVSARRLRVAFRGSGVRRRFSVLPDFAPAFGAPVLFRGDDPTTAERLRVFAGEAPLLAERAARIALHSAGVAPAHVSHLLFVTCTGFAAPGPDQDLVECLGLPLSVRRVQIGFQGCSAGVVALRTAAEIIRGNPSAIVLVVSVELSSLHFQRDLDDESLRGHALFADGAGAALVGHRRAGPAGHARTPEKGLEGLHNLARDGGRLDGRQFASVRLDEARSLILPSGCDEMTWRVADTGFRMRLTNRIPGELSRALPSIVGGFGAKPFRHWAVHPGGPAILDAVARSLLLPQGVLAPSREVLREFGNMSSATIFFVMERIVASGAAGPGLALAFGPGLTSDALAFDVVFP
jgi:predicted naringenin-chalcone synthase